MTSNRSDNSAAPSAREVEADLARLKEIVADLKGPGSPLEAREAVIDGITMPVFAHVEDNLREVYKLGLQTPERDFLVYRDERHSFAQTLEQATAMAKVLQARYGIAKGDRVALCSRNNPEWCMAYLAATMIGAIVVPMNAWWQRQELRYGLQDSGARLLFADQQRIDLLDTVPEGLEIIAIKPEASTWPEFFALVDEGRRAPGNDPESIPIAPDDEASIMYTSGSTGHPKGVLSTHRNIISALYTWVFARRATETLRPELVEDDSALPPGILANVPLFHVTGCHAQFLLSFPYLRKFVMMYKWNPEEALALIESERLSVLHGVPTMTWEVLNSPRFEATDLSSLRTIQSGGAARPPGHLALIQEKFGDRAQPGQGYGLTETNAIGATITGRFYLAKPESTGRPTPPVTQMRIVDDDGNALPNGQTGEICIKGATVMKGYWNRPEETARVLRDGWLHTGDLGLFDEHGFLMIKDRAKDIVIRGGENVACADVEYALAEHPRVREAAVYGLPDERLGEIVAATVSVTGDADIDRQQLQDFLMQYIARFKIPEYIIIRQDRLDRLATGKIDKKALRQQALQQRFSS